MHCDGMISQYMASARLAMLKCCVSVVVHLASVWLCVCGSGCHVTDIADLEGNVGRFGSGLY
jgi:hypothetical protein